jgi:hypothetical protein
MERKNGGRLCLLNYLLLDACIDTYSVTSEEKSNRVATSEWTRQPDRQLYSLFIDLHSLHQRNVGSCGGSHGR